MKLSCSFPILNLKNILNLEMFSRPTLTFWKNLFSHFRTGAQRPYMYRPKKQGKSFESCSAQLQRMGVDVLIGYVDHINMESLSAVRDGFANLGLAVHDFEVDLIRYQKYIHEAKYQERYPEYYKTNLSEKSLEHFLAFQILDIKPGEVFVDVASENSPVPEIFSRLGRCVSYRQDIMYPPGVHGDQIGGDACQMPIPAGFSDKLALTCSLEHFEGESDTKLFYEFYRILKPGGKFCVVPFYVYIHPANQVDPTVSVPHHVPLDCNAKIYCTRGWGNRFARFYSPESFFQRIFKPTQNLFDYRIFQIINPDALPPNTYARFVLLGTKK
jgi:SAM-dependent methyltransferase